MVKLHINCENNSLVDADLDGFPDDLEEQVQTDPQDAASTPLPSDASMPDEPGPLHIDRIAIRLKFRALDRDRLRLRGRIDQAALEDTRDLEVCLYVGGLVLKGKLDERRRLEDGSLRFGRPRNGEVVFKAKMKGALQSELADEGFTGDRAYRGVQRMLRIMLILGGNVYATDQRVRYSAKPGVSGKAK